MTINDSRVIDWLGIERGTGFVVLTIADDQDWTDEDKHIELLQEKLNTYLSFIESGEVFERLEQEVGRSVPVSTPIKISVLAQFALPHRAKEFFEYARTAIHDAGFELTFKVVRAPS